MAHPNKKEPVVIRKGGLMSDEDRAARADAVPSEVQILYRNAVPEDIPFIFNSWLKSFRAGYFVREVANSAYYAEQHKVIEMLLKRCNVLIACDANDPSNLYGYICHEKIQDLFVTHFIYIKHTFRSLGIGTALAKKAGLDTSTASLCSHLNMVGEKLALRKNVMYSPYLLINYQAK